MRPSLLQLSLLLVLLVIGPLALVWAQQDVPISDDEMTLVSFANLEYPKLASQALIQGIVIIRAKLSDKGSVIDATALSGADALIPACLENARKWRFRPNPKKSVVIVYKFKVSGALRPGCSHFMVEPPNFATITTCAHEIQ
jgi:TonB family protein